MSLDPNRYVTAAEAAFLACVCVDTIRRWSLAGKIQRHERLVWQDGRDVIGFRYDRKEVRRVADKAREHVGLQSLDLPDN